MNRDGACRITAQEELPSYVHALSTPQLCAALHAAQSSWPCADGAAEGGGSADVSLDHDALATVRIAAAWLDSAQVAHT